MKRLILLLITVSSLTFAQPWNTKQDLAYKLPNADKDKLNTLLASIQSVEGWQEGQLRQNPGWNQSFSRTVNALLDQIDRAKSGMSLSGWASSLSANDRITAIKDSVAYILQETVLKQSSNNSKLYASIAQQTFISGLNRILAYKE